MWLRVTNEMEASIFTLPSVCVTGTMQVQFQASCLLLGMKPTHYGGGISTHYVPHLQYMCLTLHMDGIVTCSTYCNCSTLSPDHMSSQNSDNKSDDGIFLLNVLDILKVNHCSPKLLTPLCCTLIIKATAWRPYGIIQCDGQALARKGKTFSSA